MDLDDDVDIAAAIIAMYDDDSNSSDEGGPGERVYVDVEGFRIMSNASFKAHFRMDRIVFQKLIVVVGTYMRATNRLIRLRTSLDLCLMMGLWPIFNPDTYRSVGMQFNKQRADIHYHYSYLIGVLSELSPRFIKWPTALERERIKARYERKYGYPGVVGCIDGVHIDITAPLENPDGYVNRHHRYSTLVQAVCDDRMLYRDVYIGNPGAIGDVRNYENSDLNLNLLTHPDMLCEGEHLLGDGAYTLTDKLIIPYADDGNIAEWMRTHNASLSACRVRVENSFALLRGRNRRLKGLPMRNPYLLNDHVNASFMLHNFILLEGNDMEGLPAAIPPRIEEEEYQRLLAAARELGAIKREFIANVLHPHL